MTVTSDIPLRLHSSNLIADTQGYDQPLDKSATALIWIRLKKEFLAKVETTKMTGKLLRGCSEKGIPNYLRDIHRAYTGYRWWRTLGNPGGYSLVISARVQQGDIEGALQQLVYAQEELGNDDGGTALIGEILSGRISEDELSDEQIETLGLGGAILLQNPEPALQFIAASAPGEIGWGMMGGLFGAGLQAIRSDPRFIDYLDRLATLEVWRELGPPAGCRAVKETFTCAGSE